MVEVHNLPPSIEGTLAAPAFRVKFFPITTSRFPQLIRNCNRLILPIVVGTARKSLWARHLQTVCFHIVDRPPQLNSFGMRSLQKAGEGEGCGKLRPALEISPYELRELSRANQLRHSSNVSCERPILGQFHRLGSHQSMRLLRQRSCPQRSQQIHSLASAQ